MTALASRSLETARAAAAALGIPKAYGSYEELLADPDVDAVYIPLPGTPPGTQRSDQQRGYPTQ